MSAAAIPTCGGGHVPRARHRPQGLGGHPTVCTCLAPIPELLYPFPGAVQCARCLRAIFEAPVIPLAVEPDPPGIVARRPRRGERKPKEQP